MKAYITGPFTSMLYFFLWLNHFLYTEMPPRLFIQELVTTGSHFVAVRSDVAVNVCV